MQRGGDVEVRAPILAGADALIPKADVRSLVRGRGDENIVARFLANRKGVFSLCLTVESGASDNGAMAVASPPRPPAQGASDALVREARERQRRRRLLLAAAIAVVAALGLAVYAVASHGKSSAKQSHDSRPLAVGFPRCRAGQLRLSQGFGGAAGGTSEAIYTFRNRAAGACVLRGWPSVRLKSPSGRLMPIRTSHALRLRPHRVELQPGGTASFGVVDSYGGYSPLCPSSRTVEITPPGDRASVSLTSSLPDCFTRSSYWSLEILPLVPGKTDHQPW